MALEKLSADAYTPSWNWERRLLSFIACVCHTGLIEALLLNSRRDDVEELRRTPDKNEKARQIQLQARFHHEEHDRRA